MPRWLKISLITIAVVLVLFFIQLYFVLRASGVISKAIFEHEPPPVGEFSRPAVLIFNKTNGHRHEEAIPVADEVFTKLATNLGYDTYVSANAAVHNPEVLKKFDLVIWNNVSGNVLTELQRQSLKSWIAKGGGWLGVHGSGGDLTYAWDWYADTLIGSRFSGHSMSPQFQDAKLYKTESGTEISGHLPEPWLVKNEEWYAFDSNPRDKGYEILITIDEDSYITHGRQFFVWNDSMEGEHPLVWRHTIGEGRVFYSAIGHRPETYRLDTYQELLKEAMQWAADD